MSSILVTGGSGALGRAFLAYSRWKGRIWVLSRGEHVQQELRDLGLDNVRFILGDVRDESKIQMAIRGVDAVLHLAALKVVPSGSYNLDEFIRTNVNGTYNVLSAAIHAGVPKVVVVTTDKGVEPINSYGATKMLQEHLVYMMNDWSKATKISAVRFGNIIDSTGAFTHKIKAWKVGDPPLEITDERMTRFWIDKRSAINFIDYVFADMQGGEVYVPKIGARRVLDLLPAGAAWKEVGNRGGEKINETLLGSDELRRTDEFPQYFRVRYAPYQGNCQRQRPYTSEKETNAYHNSSDNAGGEPTPRTEVQEESGGDSPPE